jgi:hypothetical protein
MIVPLSSAEDDELVDRIMANAAEGQGSNPCSNPLPRVKLFRSASLASWSSPKQWVQN